MQALELTLNMRTGRAWRGLADHRIRTPRLMDEDMESQRKGSMTHPKSWRRSQGWLKSTSPDLQPRALTTELPCLCPSSRVCEESTKEIAKGWKVSLYRAM